MTDGATNSSGNAGGKKPVKVLSYRFMVFGAVLLSIVAAIINYFVADSRKMADLQEDYGLPFIIGVFSVMYGVMFIPSIAFLTFCFNKAVRKSQESSSGDK